MVTAKYTIMPDADKPLWQYMHGKPSYKFFVRQWEQVLFTTFPVVLGREGHLAVIDILDAVVTYRDLMRVSTKIFDDLLGTEEGAFAIYYPSLLEEPVIEMLGQFKLFPESGHEPCPEHLCHGLYREQEPATALGVLPFTAMSGATTRYDAVQMEADADMVISRIIQKLKQVAPDEAEFKKSLQQLVTLSRIRKLEERTEKQIAAMPITYDIETDYLYLKGKEKVIINLLEQTSMTIEQIAKVAEVSVETVLKVKESLKK